MEGHPEMFQNQWLLKRRSGLSLPNTLGSVQATGGHSPTMEDAENPKVNAALLILYYLGVGRAFPPLG